MADRSTRTRPGSPPVGAGHPTPAAGLTPAAEALAAGTADVRLRPAFEVLAQEAVSVVSFDVFDTLLWRKVPEPRDAFELLGSELAGDGLLAPGVGADVFASMRARAEKRARQVRRDSGRGVEVTLDEVYGALPESLLRAGVSREELARREVDLERRLLVPDLDVLELARAARAGGRRVIGVSDTYFSEDHLRSFLGRPPLDPELIDRVFASSSHGAGKGGGLWSTVLHELGVPPEQVLHVGDNHDADVVAPQALGIRTAFFERRPAPLARVMERERVLGGAPLHPRHGDHGLSALRAKVVHRAEADALPAGMRPFWDYGAASLGPVFAGFAEWAHERAREAGVSRMFCLMREGELLSGLFNAAGEALGSPVRAEPIWLSRQVCARASIRDGTREELERMFVRRRMPTLREFCHTIGLNVESDLPDLAAEADARIDGANLGERAIEAITFSAEVRARVVAQSRELRERVVRYVESRRPPGEDRLFLVDLGWGATIQSLLERMLREAGTPCRTTGLYLLTRDQAAGEVLDGLDARGFLGSGGVPKRAVDTVMRSPELLEQVCMPDHGTQVGLTADLEPVLAPWDEPDRQRLERAAAQVGIHAFLREWLRYRAAAGEALAPLHDGGEDALRAILVRAVAGPTLEEAALFGRWLHDENFGSQAVEEIVAGPSARAVRYLDPQALFEIPMSELYWPFALAALHDENLALATEAAASGALPWEAFRSTPETGAFEIYGDFGWGYTEAGKVSLEPRRNRFGLSFAKAELRGDFVKRLRLDPAKRPCVLRIDWIRLRCAVHGSSDPVLVELDAPRDLSRVKLRGCRPIGPNLLLAAGDDPQLHVDVEREAGGRVYVVDVEVAYAVLPVARRGLRERWGRTKAALRRWAKGSWAGAPLRLARRVLGR
jgi:FMN phosphatase YigB (HAD superfamily)